MNEKSKLQLKINRAKYNLMFMATLTVINIITIFFGDKILMPFSSALACYSAIFGIRTAYQTENNVFTILGIFIAIVVIALLLLCYLKLKSNPLFFAISFGFVVADTLSLMLFSLFAGYFLHPSTFLDIALHIMTILYIFGGMKASNLISQGKFIETHNETDTVDDDSNEGEEEEEEEEIIEYVDRGEEILINGRYKKYNVFISKNDESIDLVINNYICSRFYDIDAQEYEISALINDIDFSFRYCRSQESTELILCADDVVINRIIEQ